MKRLRCVLVLAMSLLALTCGCRASRKVPTIPSPTEPIKSKCGSNLEISITPSSPTISATEPIQLVFKNHTDRTLAFGEYYKMEYKKDEWVPVDLTGMHFGDILYEVKAGEEVTQDFYFPIKFKPDLPSGLYRVIYLYSTYDENSVYGSDEKTMQFEITYSN